MFADGIRVEGLRLLAKHRIAEGIGACVKYTREQNPWASEHRTPELMEILLTYGTHAKQVIPELKKIANYLRRTRRTSKETDAHESPVGPRTIDAIEASTDTP